MQDERKTLDDRNKMTELERLRHSCAHVMATAILRLWPDAQFAAGPPVENGFYYDVELEHRITPEDFPAIEAEMKKEIKANRSFEKVVVTREQAIKDSESGRLGGLSERPGNPSKFKLGNLADIPDGEPITYFKSGDFIDLCAGPHVMRTGNIGAFKLTSVASAYYKGDEKNPQLQRIYGTAFKNKTELEAYFKMLEEAKKRDHRKIGQEMGLFALDAEFTGPGLPLWLPKGAAIAEELEKLAKETEFLAGYVRVKTPHIAKEKMYLTSGHLPLLYKDSMFPPMELVEEENRPDKRFLEARIQLAIQKKQELAGTGDAEKIAHWDQQQAEATEALDKVTTRYYLKAMNCPHHHRIFAAEPRSYRDLPLRLAEYGTCYRYEQSGELFGLMRVRSLNMNDAHIYCTPEQFAQEFNAVNEMYLKYFKIFGLGKYVMRFSTHAPEGMGKKYVNEPELWQQTEDMVRNVLKDSGINYVEVANEAAFYGPKIDVQVWSVIGREFTLATNQVDFAVPAALRPGVSGQGQHREDAALHPPRAAGHARAVHRLPHRALRRQLPALARARAGAGADHRRGRAAGELRQGDRAGVARQHGPRRRRLQQRQDQRQDPASRTGQGPHHAGRRPAGHGGQRGQRPRPRQGQPRGQTQGGSRGGDSGGDPRAAGVEPRKCASTSKARYRAMLWRGLRGTCCRRRASSLLATGGLCTGKSTSSSPRKWCWMRLRSVTRRWLKSG